MVAECFIENPENKQMVDHINQVKTDNRACNLRWATNSENQQNIKQLRANNSSGHTGVQIEKHRNNTTSWRARITLNGKRMNIGSFKNYDDAVKARLEAERKYFNMI